MKTVFATLILLSLLSSLASTKIAHCEKEYPAGSCEKCESGYDRIKIEQTVNNQTQITYSCANIKGFLAVLGGSIVLILCLSIGVPLCICICVIGLIVYCVMQGSKSQATYYQAPQAAQQPAAPAF